MPELPQVFTHDDPDDESAAAKTLAQRLEGLGIEAPFVLASPHGKGIAAALRSPQPPEEIAPRADQHWAVALGARAQRGGADAIVAIGGGRTLDLGKLAAARAGLKIVTVPTQLAHDGICSPVAVVANEEGVADSLGAIAPHAVFLSMPTLLKAPPETLGAGLGDLLANPLALKDWTLAAERGLEEIDQQAWDASIESFELIEPYLDTSPRELVVNPGAVRRVADALVLSGLAMIYSGTSRPASGGEHEISHAIDEEFGGRDLHGAQVAFGCIFSVALYGEDVAAFRARLKRLQLPQHPMDLGLSRADTVHVLLKAPETRPGRFTIIEQSDLDEAKAAALIDRIWGR